MTLDNTTHPTIDAATNRFQGGQGYVFDKNGNLTTDAEGRTFVFNGDNKQNEVRDASNAVVGQYFYDGEGRRDKKVTDQDTTVFVYSAGKLVAEYSTAPPPQEPTTKWTVTDQLGSPRVLVDSLGQVVARRDFMPFGEEIFPDGTHRKTADKYTFGDDVRQKFTGYQKDEETQLDFAEARMYQNQHARFTAVDPLLASGKSANPQTFNRYVYVMNNPLAYTDPTGLQAATTLSPCDTGPDCNLRYNKKSNTIRGNGTSAIHEFVEVVSEAAQLLVETVSTGISYLAYGRGGTDDFDSRTSSGPLGATSGSLANINPTSGPSITGFNTSFEEFNNQVIQRVPLFSNLVNAQIAGRNNNYVSFGTEMGMFGVDLGTSVFTGGMGSGLRRGAQEAAEASGRRGFNLALGLSDNLDDFARATNSQTYVQRASSRLFVPERFAQFANEATEINFNLRNFSFGDYKKWLETGNGNFFRNHTNYELDQILSNPEWRRKTNFFVYPQQ